MKINFIIIISLSLFNCSNPEYSIASKGIQDNILLDVIPQIAERDLEIHGKKYLVLMYRDVKTSAPKTLLTSFIQGNKDFYAKGQLEFLLANSDVLIETDIKQISTSSMEILIDLKRVEQVFNDYDDEVLGLSLITDIALNQEADLAMFYFESAMGDLGSIFQLIIAEKNQDRWILKESIPL